MERSYTGEFKGSKAVEDFYCKFIYCKSKDKSFVLDLKLLFIIVDYFWEGFPSDFFLCETNLFHWFSWVIISYLIYYSVMHDIDVCLFNQRLFIIDLINNLALKLFYSINRGLNFLIKIFYDSLYYKW